MQRPLEEAMILIVDDQEPNIILLEGFLRQARFKNIKSSSDPRHVLPLFQTIKPDLILLDLHMSHLDGFEVMRQLKSQLPADSYLPILVLTADVTPQAKQRALAGGAKDFLTKPFDYTEVILRIRNLLETRFLHLELHNQNQSLEIRVQERTSELENARVELVSRNRDLKEAQIETLERLAIAGEYRDDDTGHHTQRVSQIAGLLAMKLGIPPAELGLIQRAAPLHDIGKIGISDLILLKPGRLTPEEFDIMKTHAQIGASILAGSYSPPLQLAEKIALNHHERWDGTGYPQGLKGEAIPLPGRIVAVADVFDALTHERPYKKAWTVEEAVAEILSQSDKQFDPRVIEAFTKLPHHALI